MSVIKEGSVSSLNTILYQISIQKGNDPHNSSLIQAYFCSRLPLYQRHFNRQQNIKTFIYQGFSFVHIDERAPPLTSTPISSELTLLLQ